MRHALVALLLAGGCIGTDLLRVKGTPQQQATVAVVVVTFVAFAATAAVLATHLDDEPPPLGEPTDPN